jgi:4-alpha-glucanotransferase
MGTRASGVLLHVTSLASPYGVGDLGPAACRFVDFLEKALQQYWQVLPVTPAVQDRWRLCPYNSSSAMAGDPLLISPDLLVRDGLLRRQDLQGLPNVASGRVQVQPAVAIKTRLLSKARQRLDPSGFAPQYERFCREQRDWLDDYSLYVAIRRHLRPRPWHTWPAGLRDRDPRALAEARETLEDLVDQAAFEQYLFFSQWSSLKAYAHSHGVDLIGDVPIYVAHESADVWAHAELFELNRDKRPRRVSGAPPDAFSRTGQLWRNPVYDWAACRREGYRWWIRRIRQTLTLFDRVRLDHFRGFAGFWAVPAGHRTAAHGRWVKGPGRDLVGRFMKEFGAGCFIAEDLGHITEDVKDLIADYELPSMRVLHFAFDGKPAVNPHYPHNHAGHCVVYTGTHDNNTTRGWFKDELSPERRREISAYVGHPVTARTVGQDLIHVALASCAELAILPMQDLLALGAEARMNRPATVRGNWLWQLREDPLRCGVAADLARWTRLYGRA